jgi:hypothetical protein
MSEHLCHDQAAIQEQVADQPSVRHTCSMSAALDYHVNTCCSRQEADVKTNIRAYGSSITYWQLPCALQRSACGLPGGSNGEGRCAGRLTAQLPLQSESMQARCAGPPHTPGCPHSEAAQAVHQRHSHRVTIYTVTKTYSYASGHALVHA